MALGCVNLASLNYMSQNYLSCMFSVSGGSKEYSLWSTEHGALSAGGKKGGSGLLQHTHTFPQLFKY